MGWVAWLERDECLVQVAWRPHVETSKTPWLRVAELRTDGHIATVTTSQRAAYAWCSDQRRLCVDCMGGLGTVRCLDCQAKRLEKQLRQSVGKRAARECDVRAAQRDPLALVRGGL